MTIGRAKFAVTGFASKQSILPSLQERSDQEFRTSSETSRWRNCRSEAKDSRIPYARISRELPMNKRLLCWTIRAAVAFDDAHIVQENSHETM